MQFCDPRVHGESHGTRSVPATWRTRYGGLIAALALATALEAAVIARSPIIAKDGIGFIRIAHELAADPAATLRTEDQHPGYPALVLAASRLAQRLMGQNEFDAAIIGAHLASALCGVVSVLGLWLFARRLYDERIANVTALLAAAWPLLRVNAADGLSDTPHLMFYLASAWLAGEGLARGRTWLLAAAGAASGLAYWVRPEGLAPGAAAGIILAIRVLSPFALRKCVRSRSETRQWALAGLVALLAAMLLVASPYVLIAGKITSKKMPFRPPPSAHAVAIASIEPTTGLLAEPRPGGTLPDEFARPAALAGVFGLGLVELTRELAQGLCYLGLIPLTIGTFAPTRPRRQPGVVGLHAALVSVHAALLILLYWVAGYISHRHVIPLVALLLPIVAAGMMVTGERLAACLPRRGAPSRAVAILVTLVVLGLMPKCLRPLNAVYAPLVRAAEWVRQHSRKGDAVLATSSYVRFYADLPGILVGPEAPNLPVGMHFAPPPGPWPFIVLEVDERAFDRGQLAGSDGPYEQRLELPAHPRKPWAKVLVFQLRPRGQRLLVAVSPNANSNSTPPGGSKRMPKPGSPE